MSDDARPAMPLRDPRISPRLGRKALRAGSLRDVANPINLCLRRVALPPLAQKERWAWALLLAPRFLLPGKPEKR